VNDMPPQKPKEFMLTFAFNFSYKDGNVQRTKDRKISGRSFSDAERKLKAIFRGVEDFRINVCEIVKDYERRHKD
jgi:hypothetical protein